MDRRRTLVTVSLGTTLLLSACAAPPWTRSDFSFAQAEQDELDCQERAERQLDLQAAGYVPVGGYYGQAYHPGSGSRMQQWKNAPLINLDLDPVPRMLEEDRIADACMRAKGYTRKS